MRRIVVNEWEQAVVFRRGAYAQTLRAGAHRLWGRDLRVRVVDMRPWVLVVPTQEIPTADGVTVKVSVAGQVRVTDARAFVVGVQEPHATLYLTVQLAVRHVIAVLTLDELVTGRATELRAELPGLDALGVVVERLELRDVVLPPDLKRAQAEVLLARAEGQAALERARGETAAMRSLANAARMAADNPALMQLRLIQQLDATSTVVVTGGATL